MNALFEALRKQKVDFKYNKNPKMRVARPEKNEPGTQVPHCGRCQAGQRRAQNIVYGGLKLVLGLVWTLILKDQISQNKADASRNALLESDQLEGC